MDTGDTNVHVSVVTPEVDVKVSCIYRKSKISFHISKLKLKFMNFKHIQCTYTMSLYVAKKMQYRVYQSIKINRAKIKKIRNLLLKVMIFTVAKYCNYH